MVVLATGPAAIADGLSIRSNETIVEDGGDRKVLRGNVVIEFGNFSFQADEVVQYFSEGIPVRYEAAGQPIIIKQAGAALKGLEEGRSETLVYLVKEKTLLLTDYELRLSGGIVQKGKEFKMVFE